MSNPGMRAERRIAELEAECERLKADIRHIKAQRHVAERKIHDMLNGVRAEQP